METLDFKIPYSEVALILDSIRHYVDYINNLDQDSIDENELADLLNDCENLKSLEASISKQFSEKFGEY